jgi:para-aminobenzoate synthetase/4-amino-4-deoxychorismate lyase
MKHIADIEAHGRGFYCGAIGLIRPGGHATFNVAIRTAVMDKFTQALSYGVGSGITWYSDVAAELEEWRTKAHFLHRASNAFHLFETLRLEDGVFARLGLHMARLANAASYFGYPFDRSTALMKLSELSQAHSSGVFRVKLCLFADGVLSTEVSVHSDIDSPISVQLALQPICAPSEYLRFKTSHRAHYDAFAPVRDGVYDTLLYQQNGDLTEFTRGNLVIEQDGILLTPKENGHFLPGVMRSELLKNHVVSEGTIRVEAVGQAARIWFINSLRGWLPVSQVLNADGSVLFCSTSN